MKKKPVRSESIIWRNVDGEIVIISSDNRSMHILNPVGSRIWELLDGEHDLEAIAAIISDEYGEKEEIVMEDLIDYFKSLEKLKLLVI